MPKVTVINKQSFFDLALQLTGDIGNALEIAQLNDRSISDELHPGEEIQYNYDLPTSKEIFKYYQSYKIIPATALSKEEHDMIRGCQGVGCWIIDLNFSVS
jgi:hypothetical protein